MKKPIYLLTLALLLSMLIAVLNTSPSNAALEGTTTVNSLITSSRTPTLSGTIRSWCSDVVIGITTTQSNEDDIQFFFSDYGQVTLDTSGNWSLNLANNNYGLVNGVYDIFIASECDYSGTYADPLYADIHYGAISIVPASCDSLCVPVYRFYNTQNGAHFYTTNEYEKRQVLVMPQYRFEGIANYAKYFRTAIPGMVAVHRFYNIQQGVHFYTANQSEASNVNATQSSTYRYEGIAYYTYSYQAPGTAPVHRFYKFRQGVHFYTANQSEASNVNATQASTYRYEGVSYYNLKNQ